MEKISSLKGKRNEKDRSNLPNSSPYIEPEGVTFTKKDQNAVLGLPRSTREIAYFDPPNHLKRSAAHSVDPQKTPTLSLAQINKPFEESAEKFLFSRHSGETSRFEGPPELRSRPS